MRALVTGAGGFIGRHLVASLADAGIAVRAFGHEAPPADVDFIHGDVLDADALRRAVAGCDAVFHLAAVYSYHRRDVPLMQAVNVEGTRNLLEAAAGGGVRRRVVHTSTCATCGPVPGRAATEDDEPAARELEIPYRRTKLAAERLVLLAAREGVEALVVNPTVPVGADDLRPTPTGKMVADVASGRARAYLADSALNVVAVEDVARGHVDAFERGRRGERYLLGGENMPIRDVFAIIARAAGRPEPRLPVPWAFAYGAALAADAALRPFGREPDLLLLDEVRSGRLPHVFDDAKARAELRYTSRPAAAALADAVAGVSRRRSAALAGS